MNNPMCRPCRFGLPQNTGSLADPVTSLEIGTDGVSGFCSGPPSPNSQTPTQIAIQLSMIVEITSLAPTVAFSTPAIPAHAAPAAQARTITSRTCSTWGIPLNFEPNQTATIEPTRYWPWP